MGKDASREILGSNAGVDGEALGMRAVVVTEFGESEVLRVTEVPDLKEPKNGDVLVKVMAAGVNPVDTYIRSGSYGALPELPYTPGRDGAGVIVGTDKRVYLSGSLTGTYAEYCLASPDQVHRLPDSVTFEEGACLGVPCATAYHALFHKAQVKPGQKVLVRGASGGVGLAAVQLAKAMGCDVSGTAGSPEGRKMVLQAGAHIVCSHRDTVGSYDVILEMLANANLDLDLEQCAPRGIVVVIGSRGSVEIDPRLFMTGDITVTGMALATATTQERRRIFEGLGEALTKQTLSPVVAETFSLEQAPRAHQRVLEAGSTGNIVLTNALLD